MDLTVKYFWLSHCLWWVMLVMTVFKTGKFHVYWRKWYNVTQVVYVTAAMPWSLSSYCEIYINSFWILTSDHSPNFHLGHSFWAMHFLWAMALIPGHRFSLTIIIPLRVSLSQCTLRTWVPSPQLRLQGDHESTNHLKKQTTTAHSNRHCIS